MPSPLTHSVLPIIAAYSSQKLFGNLSRKQTFATMGILCGLALAPDLDLVPAYFFKTQFTQIHRAWGHNLFSAAVFSWLGAILLGKACKSALSFRKGFFLSFFSVSSHLVLDSLGHLDFELHDFSPGVPLFWPISSKMMSIPFRVMGTPLSAHEYPYNLTKFSWLTGIDVFLMEVIPVAFIGLGVTLLFMILSKVGRHLTDFGRASINLVKSFRPFERV